MNTNIKLEIRVACREFLAFKYVVIVCFQKKTDDYLKVCTSEILKTRV